MDWMYFILAAIVGVAGGFVAGVLVGRNNPGDVEKVIKNITDEIARDQKALDEKKAQLVAAAQVLAAKVKV